MVVNIINSLEPAVQQTLDGSSCSPAKPERKLVVHGSSYEPGIPAVLLAYAEENPYLNAASSYALAEVFGVSHQTICNWMKNHDEFREAVQTLRERQLNRVESAMMKRILGCTLKTTRVAKTEAGAVEQIVEKELPPDASLIRYYLEHRCPKRWGDAGGDATGKQVTVVVEHDPEEFA